MISIEEKYRIVIFTNQLINKGSNIEDIVLQVSRNFSNNSNRNFTPEDIRRIYRVIVGGNIDEEIAYRNRVPYPQAVIAHNSSNSGYHRDAIKPILSEEEKIEQYSRGRICKFWIEKE